MSLPNFADLGKITRDLLTKNFPGEKSKVETTTNTSNGATYVSSATRDFAKGSVVGLFNPKFKYSPYGLNINTSVGTDNKLKAEVSVENQLADGVKTTVVAQRGDTKALSPFKATLEYVTSGFTGNLAVDLFAPADTYVTGSFVGGHENFVAGVEVQAAVSAQALHGAKGLLGYRNKEFEIFGTVTRNAESAVEGNVTYYHNASSSLQVGGELIATLRTAPPPPAPAAGGATSGAATSGAAATTSTAPAVAPAPAAPAAPAAPLTPKFSFVGNYKLSDDLTTKFKFDQEGVLSLASYHQLNKNVKLGLGATLATTNLSGGSHKFGTELLFNF